MAQKSLPILNKVNTSMIWYSTYYSKNYKWLSSQILYFLYFFNKLTVFLDIFFRNILWVWFEKTSLSYNYKSLNFVSKNEIRFFKPVTSFLINLQGINLVINVFYKTSLQRFQQINWQISLNSSPINNFKNVSFIKKTLYI